MHQRKISMLRRIMKDQTSAAITLKYQIPVDVHVMSYFLTISLLRCSSEACLGLEGLAAWSPPWAK